MLLKTSSELRDRLLKKPESGMGYQIALIGKKRYAVSNAQLAVPLLYLPFHLPLFLPDSESKSQFDPSSPISDNSMYRLHLTPMKPDSEDPPPPHGFAVTTEHSRAFARFTETSLATKDPATPIEELPELDGNLGKVETHHSYRTTTVAGELFIRYTAFQIDFRIDTDGSVLPGTYVTTQTDSPHVPSGLAAVARYALPNPMPAQHRFVLSPPTRTAIHCGTSTPQFGQSGGGVEVRFDKPLPAGTASGPQLIPER